MLALVLTALMIWAGSIAGSLRDQNEQLWTMYRARTQQQEMMNVSESVEQFYRENTTFPASLAALSTSPGYEHVRSSLNTWQGYGVSPSISDALWTFQRVVVFTNDPTKKSSTDYLAANECGTGGYDTAQSWCGSKTSMWYRKESREAINEQIVTQRARLNRLTQKFATYFNGPAPLTIGVAQKYPDKDRSNVSLAPNSISSLAALVGYSGAANNCSGEYQFQGLPIDCGDMFDLWGGKIGYQFINGDHIILVSETPIFDSSGNRVVIAADRT
jgi:hypothetical protein